MKAIQETTDALAPSCNKYFLALTAAICIIASFSSLPLEARTVHWNVPCRDWTTAQACNTAAQGRGQTTYQGAMSISGHICQQCGWDPARKPSCVTGGEIACH